ncbi:MAG: pantetheine-phosphate adenylyltransferase [Clostridia bacterium]|nr:pantetheine-phosphate adenylyltransferase [Clostridia bacterium]
MAKTAIYPGSFDPVTNGHLDLIRRASRLFDRVIVVVMTNYNKIGNYSFTVEERMDLIRRVTGDLRNVEVDSDCGLLAAYAERKNADVIIKGLRAVSDFENEFQQALINNKLNPNVETMFFTAASDNMFLSSSLLKQVCALGGDVSQFLPPEICADITARLQKKQ